MNSNLEGALSLPFTGKGIAPIRIEHTRPSDFRVAQYPDGRQIVQGCYLWSQGRDGGHVWRDLPLVMVDELGGELPA